MPYDALLLSKNEVEAYKEKLLTAGHINEQTFFITQEQDLFGKITLYNRVRNQIQKSTFRIKDLKELDDPNSLVHRKISALTGFQARPSLFVNGHPMTQEILSTNLSEEEMGKQRLTSALFENGGHEPPEMGEPQMAFSPSTPPI